MATKSATMTFDANLATRTTPHPKYGAYELLHYIDAIATLWTDAYRPSWIWHSSGVCLLSIAAAVGHYTACV